MISNTLPLINWDWGLYGAIFMFVVFLGLIITLFVFLRSGNKKSE